MSSSADTASKKQQAPVSCVLNDKGEEVPITDEMVKQSLDEVKFQSMGVHTGINKIITDEMLAGIDKE